MGLETCPDCSQAVSERARICVHCGAPLFRPTGVDRGFHLLYGGLSYRRKFIRTFWVICLTPLLLIVPQGYSLMGKSIEVWTFVALAVGFAQLLYNFVMWHAVEGS
jgi:hypothetical protein